MSDVAHPALARPCPPGTDPGEWARCAHMVAFHGLEAIACPSCEGGGCAACDGEGVLWRLPDRDPCDHPSCPQRGSAS